MVYFGEETQKDGGQDKHGTKTQTPSEQARTASFVSLYGFI
jgi:hypothetical protein